MKNIFKGGLTALKDRSLIQITGNTELLAESCGEVQAYDETQLVFKAKKKITVEGTGLVMTNLESGAVSISGTISAIKFGE